MVVEVKVMGSEYREGSPKIEWNGGKGKDPLSVVAPERRDMAAENSLYFQTFRLNSIVSLSL